METEVIREKICEIRGARVMLDADRAALCGKSLPAQTHRIECQTFKTKKR